MRISIALLKRIISACKLPWQGVASITATPLASGETRFSAYDGHLAAAYILGESAGNSLVGTVDARLLTKSLSGMRGDIVLTGDEWGWRVESGTTSREIPLDVSESGACRSPVYDGISGSSFTLPVGAVEYALRAVSADTARPILCAVLLDDRGLIATDSYRLHIAPLSTAYDRAPILLESDALRRAIVVAKHAKLDTISLITDLSDDSVYGRTYRVSAAGIASFTVTYSHLADATFPAYRQLMPTNTETITLRRGDLSDALVMAPKDAAAVLTVDDYKCHGMRLMIDYRALAKNDLPEGSLLGSSSVGISSLSAGIDSDPSATNTPITAVNATFLRDTIAVGDAADEITLGVVDSLKPIVLGDSRDNKYALLMPIKIKGIGVPNYDRT